MKQSICDDVVQYWADWFTILTESNSNGKPQYEPFRRAVMSMALSDPKSFIMKLWG